MWNLRIGKPKLIALGYVIIPFIIIQFFGGSDHNYPEIKFDPSPILVVFILTWVFDTFAFLVGSKFGKNKILPKISPKKSYLTHISHLMGFHNEVSTSLPKNIFLAYDTLSIYSE